MHAALYDFEFVGWLSSDTNDQGTLRAQVEAQLLFTTGQLNEDRSVAQLGQLEVSWISATLVPPPPPAPPPPPPPDPAPGDPPPADPAPAPDPAPVPAPPPRYDVWYQAKLPVAWAGAPLSKYSFKLPARLSLAEQAAFATKYSRTCVDPTVGMVDAGSMFLFYRPHQPGCAPAAEDVSTFDATVTKSTKNTEGRFPEYHRVWQDGALEAVAIFTRELDTPGPGDEGVWAYDDFVWRAEDYLAKLQPDRTKRSAPSSGSGAGVTTTKVSAELRDGRRIAIDVRLVGHALADEGTSFDIWYDRLTPKADIVLYNGHAGLGANVRTLMKKGTFVPGQYLIWFANGCDTFAYVDRTLVNRRALLNPDDPGGTKYMDTVTNVMAGYFGQLSSTSLTLIEALVDALDDSHAPKTYAKIFENIDPEQIVVVTGEEDNALGPIPPAPYIPPEQTGGASSSSAPAAGGGDGQGGDVTSGGGTADEPVADAAASDGGGGCSIGRDPRPATSGVCALGLGLALFAYRRRGRKG